MQGNSRSKRAPRTFSGGEGSTRGAGESPYHAYSEAGRGDGFWILSSSDRDDPRNHNNVDHHPATQRRHRRFSDEESGAPHSVQSEKRHSSAENSKPPFRSFDGRDFDAPTSIPVDSGEDGGLSHRASPTSPLAPPSRRYLIVSPKDPIDGQDSDDPNKEDVFFQHLQAASIRTDKDGGPNRQVSSSPILSRRRSSPSSSPGTSKDPRTESESNGDDPFLEILQEMAKNSTFEHALDASPKVYINKPTRDLSPHSVKKREDDELQPAPTKHTVVLDTDPRYPVLERKFNVMMEEYESLKNKLVDMERHNARIARLNEAYREELIIHRRQLGLSVSSLMNPLVERVPVSPVDGAFQVETDVRSLNPASPWM